EVRVRSGVHGRQRVCDLGAAAARGKLLYVERRDAEVAALRVRNPGAVLRDVVVERVHHGEADARAGHLLAARDGHAPYRLAHLHAQGEVEDATERSTVVGGAVARLHLRLADGAEGAKRLRDEFDHVPVRDVVAGR